MLACVVGASLAGCAYPNDLPGARDPGPTELPFKHAWKNRDAGNTWLAAMFQVAEPTAYELRAQTDARWESEVLFEYVTLITETANNTVTKAGVGRGSLTTCVLYDAPPEDGRCPARSSELNPASKFSGTLQSGIYVVAVRAYGAASAEFHVEMSLNRSIDVLSVGEGETQVLLIGPPSDPEAPGPFDAVARWNTTNPFLATFNSARADISPNFSAAHGNDESVQFNRAQSQVYRTADGTMTNDPSFSGTSGSWEFAAHGGRSAHGEPSYAMVGIMLRPGFVSDDGSLPQIGGT